MNHFWPLTSAQIRADSNLTKERNRMKTRRTFRLISLVMLIVAAVFIFCALSNPAFGKTIYIGSFVFGAEQWRFCYKVYAIVMVGLFVASFFVKEKK